ncbi:MAG: hypothetical protein ABSF23_09805 [Terracidiphilus sp.]|jgi:sugar lactone lactonase YvrE
MATTSFIALRRFAGYAFTLMIVSLCLTGIAVGQGSPLVTATSAVGLTHPTGWGAIQQTAIDKAGDWFVVDYANGALYEFPAGGGAAIALSGVGGLGGGYQNPGVAIDPGNNLYLEANWNNCVVMFPWNSATQTWTGLSTLSPTNATTNMCTNSGSNEEAEAWAQYGIGTSDSNTGWPYWFQPWGIAIGTNNNLIIGTQTNGQFIFSLAVNSAWTNPKPNTVTWEPITGLTKRSISVAQDPEGNIYFVEDSGGPSGVLEVPATVTNAKQLQSDSGLTRVDPSLPAVTGVVTDAAGNLYISDSTVGVVEVPNPSGTPQTSSAVLVTGVHAQGEVAIDWTRNTMYVPTNQSQTNGQADVAKVGLGYAEFGSSPKGTTATPGANVVFGFNGSVTPASFSIVEDGVTTPDFEITGGTCTTGVAYSASQSCLQSVSFTPNSVGSISARLLMLDAKGNVLASMVLHGVGTGANIQATPAMETAIGSGMKTPSQVAVDAVGDVYVADAGLGKVLRYAAGSSTSTSIGTGLTAPTGVAVDGTGDVFIADSNGSVYEVPFGPTGLSASGQVTLVSGLGNSLQLAADGLGSLYIADPSNARVVKVSNIGASTASNLGQTVTKLTTGFTAPSAVAVDSSNNLYVVDGANLFELAGGSGTPATLLSNLSGATGVAVDPSGAVYITAAGGTVRIPSVSGVLVTANETAIAATVTNPAGVALDRSSNIYLVDGTALKVHVVAVTGAITLPTPGSLTSSTNATATIVNSGNAALTISGYVNTNPLNASLPSYGQLPVDFIGADGSCVGSSPVPAGGTCQVVITFQPGAGEQGTLNGQIGITSTAVNSPIVINATGVGPSLSASVTAATIKSTAEVVNTPLTVTITPKTGTGIPTGTVTVLYPSWVVVTPSSGTNAGIPTITPTANNAVTATLDATGKATFALAPVLAGTDSFIVNYSGDRTYGKSTQTVTSTVAKSAISSIALPTFPDATDINLPFVPAGTGSGTVPYDGSELPWQYSFIMKVNTAAGVPTGTITVMDSVTSCPPGTSSSGIGAATCILAGYTSTSGYSGVACPNSSGSGVLTIANAGTATGAQAAFPTSCLWYVPQGVSYSPVIFTHYVNPVYSGDANFLGLTGPTSTLLQSVRGPVVQITQTGNAASLKAAPTLSISAGSTASMNLTLTSILGYGIAGKNSQLNATNFPVSLSCDNLPPHTQCSFSYPNPDPAVPNAVDITCPSGATTAQIAAGTAQCSTGQATVTFYTDISVGTTTGMAVRDTAVTLAAIFGFGMFGLFFRRKAFEKGRMLLMIVLMIVGGALAVSITACNTTTLTSGTTLVTPKGTYAVTITAQEVGTLCASEPGGAGDNCIVPGSGSSTNNGILVYGSQNQVSLPFYVNLTVQ